MQGLDKLFELTVGQLLAKQAVIQPEAVAVDDYGKIFTYPDFDQRVNRVAQLLRRRGVARGDRIAVLAHNCHEFLEIQFACAKTGVIAACLNTRLSPSEIRECMELVDPKLLFLADRYVDKVGETSLTDGRVIPLGSEYEELISAEDPSARLYQVRMEDPLLILFTSGTTGLPKGAVISHRSMIWRLCLYLSELAPARDECFPCWSPLFHMAGADYALGTLMYGGKVAMVDGFDVPRVISLIEEEKISYLPVISGVIERLVAQLKAQGTKPRSVRVIGAMADLLPSAQLPEVTAVLKAPFLNSFGMTEVGTAPASGGVIGVGETPAALFKRESAFCSVRLVDQDDREVADGEPGELLVRGPSLFSGYWNDPDATAEAFRGGWFHTGDVFRRTPEGLLDFVERRTFMIKSGGENVYPAEIERVLLADSRITEACVVPRKDPEWGEVPVCFVATSDPSVTSAAVVELCRRKLAGYKKPKEVHFLRKEDFARNAAGKIDRKFLMAMAAGKPRPVRPESD